MCRNRRTAFTYVELTMTVLIVGIVTAVSLPDPEKKSEDEIVQITGQWEADVAYARAFSAANPDDPMVIKIDGANNYYYLARKSNPTTPASHPVSKKPFERCFKPSGEYKDVTIIGADVGTNNILEFAPTGEIKLDRDALVTFQIEGDRYEVSVSANAADVKTRKLSLSAVVAGLF